ncbi:MAG: hypothetical protein ACON5K_04705, partial [Bacteroidia bacterium]
MNKYLIFSISFFLSFCVKAQYENAVFPLTASGSSSQTIFNIGQPIIGSFEATSYSLEQGFLYFTTDVNNEVTLNLTSDKTPGDDITNCDDIKVTAEFNQEVTSPVMLLITDSSSNTFELGMTPVTATPSSSVVSTTSYTTWEANWMATASYSLGEITMTVSHSGAEVISTTDSSSLASLSYNLTDNAVDCNQVTLIIDHPDLIVSYNDGPITVEATFAEAQTDSPTLVYTDFGGTTSLTMNTTSGTTDRKQWEYNLFFSGPDEQKQLSVGSSSLTVTFDSTPSSIYSVAVNENNTAVDVIFTEDLFADYISHTATGTVVASDFSLTISSTTASLT